MSLASRRVAVLGATGHVGKCVTAGLLNHGVHEVTAVARNTPAVAAFLEALPDGAAAHRCSFTEFPERDFDVIINCVGAGTPNAIQALGPSIFALTEEFDDLVFAYLDRHPGALCVAMSSGAAYGGDFSSPAGGAGETSDAFVGQAPNDHYGRAKMASEERHRAATGRAIVDLRLFGLFSRFVDLSSPSLMSDIVRALLDRDELVVSADDIVRDYVDPDDLVRLLLCVLDAGPRNDVFDVFSAAPVSKSALLEAFAERYGLHYAIDPALAVLGVTGLKPDYYSLDRHAESIGYAPKWTSLEALCRETDAVLSAARRSAS